MKLLIALFALMLLTVGSASAAPQTHQVYVNTSAVAGQSGYLEFQFNPGNNAQSAFAQLLSFETSGGSLTGAPATAGDVTGALPGTVTLGNSFSWNDYFQGFNFGNSIHFTFLLDGPAVSSPNGTAGGGSDFGFSMFAADQFTPLLTNNPSGLAMTAALRTDGSTALNYGPSTSPVPEPSTVLLLGLGMAGAALWRKKSNRNP